MFNERLIWEDGHFMLIATLGQISDGGYLVLATKDHIPCIGAVEERKMKVLERWVQDGKFAVSREFGCDSVSVFEHGIVGQTIQHAHIHLVPGAWDVVQRIREDFPESVVEWMDSLSEIRERYEVVRMPYLMFEDRGSGLGIVWNPPAPKQYFRKLVAEFLERPERADWRAMDPDLDRQLWSGTVRRLKPYFVPLIV